MKKVVISIFAFAIVFNFVMYNMAKADIFVTAETSPNSWYFYENHQSSEISPSAFFNATIGNAIIPNHGIDSMLYCLSLGTMNAKFEKFCALSPQYDRQKFIEETNVLNRKEFYYNDVSAKTSARFNLLVKADLEKIGAEVSEQGYGSCQTCKYGCCQENVILKSDVIFQMEWQDNMTKKQLIWNSSKNVNGFIGRVNVSRSYAPNGAEVFHLQMKENVIISIVKIKDLDKNGVAKWLPESFKTSGESEKKTIHMPSIQMESKIKLSDFSSLGFLLNDSLFFGNSENAKVEAFVNSKFTLNEKGVNNNSNIWLQKVSQKKVSAEITFDQPFVAVLSVIEEGNIIPIMTTRVINP